MTDNELRELQERAHQIRQLHQQPGWAMLADYAQAVKEAKLRELVHGQGRTLEQHREAAGFVQGVQFVLAAADELDKRIAALTTSK